jgi:hypothetical protein
MRDAVLDEVERGSLVVVREELRVVVMVVEGQEEEFLGPEDDGERPTWLEVVLLDTKGRPVPNERYCLTLATGEERLGRLDRNGRVRVQGVTGDDFTIFFPDRAAA